MGWETRNGRGRYYTRSRKVNGRVVREYVGNGVSAELYARLDALDRERRAEETEARRLDWERSRERESQLDALCILTDLLVARSLQAAGYHKHKRGEWRRRRER